MGDEIECRACSGSGLDGRRACSRCDGSRVERCFDCTDPATRTSLSDHDVHLCAACGVKDDLALTEWLASVGITGETAMRWMARLAVMPTVDVHALCRMTDEQYVALARGAVGVRGAA